MTGKTYAHKMAEMSGRIRELEALIEQEGDGLPPLPASQHDFLVFTGEPWVTARPCVTALPCGHLRALWRDDRGRQVGIRFCGHGVVRLVLFSRPFGQVFISRFSGQCLLGDVPQMLRVLQLHDLLADPRLPQSADTGIGAIFGQWPGDETEAQIAEALERLS